MTTAENKPGRAPALTPADFAYRLAVPLRWSDMDTLGHVNNARFLTFDEQARLTYFEAVAKADPAFWQGYGLILAKSQLDFVAQMRYPAALEVGYRVERIGRSSLTARAGLFADGRLCGVVESVIVTFDYQAQKPVPVPEAFRAVVRGIEGDRLVEG